MKRIRFGAIALVALAGCQTAPPASPERLRYVRLGSRGSAPECSFAIERRSDGWTIESVTGTLRVFARYDPSDRLLEASAGFQTGEAAQATVADGRVKVLRPGQPPQDFDAPPGIIVTSAPDWSDVLRICRLWKRDAAGPQEFPGLWIHPQKAAQRLTFRVEPAGTASIRHGDVTLDLDRLSIRLRGNNRYVAWVDRAGRLVKLMSMPPGEGSAVLALEGFEAAAAALRPE